MPIRTSSRTPSSRALKTGIASSMLPGVDPLAGFVRRGRFVALTEITLGYQAGREWVLRDVEAIVVNRDLVEWIQPATDESTAFPDVPIKADPRAKELAWGLAR